MKNIKLTFLLLILTAVSCNKDDENDNSLSLFGIYTETQPFNKHHQMNFIEGNKVIITETGILPIEYNYEIIGSGIKISSMPINGSTFEYVFEIIDEHKFRILSFGHFQIPESPEIFTDFEKTLEE